MRKIFYMPLMALVMLFFGASCTSPQEEDVFDKSASERINGTISEYHKLLTSSEYGWVFENYLVVKNRTLEVLCIRLNLLIIR